MINLLKQHMIILLDKIEAALSGCPWVKYKKRKRKAVLFLSINPLMNMFNFAKVNVIL